MATLAPPDARLAQLHLAALAAAPVLRLRRLQPTAPPVIQRVIEAGRKDFVGRKVVHEKLGEGVIKELSGADAYRVEFESREDVVNAAELDFHVTGAGAGLDAVESESSSSDRVNGKAEESEEEEEGRVIPKATFGTPAVLKLEKGSKRKKWHLSLLSDGGEVMLRIENMGESTVKPLIGKKNRVTKDSLRSVAAGSYPIAEDAEFRGPLRAAYEKAQAAFVQKAEQAEIDAALGAMKTPKHVPAQNVFFKRLQTLDGVKRKPEGGGIANLQMTKIRLTKGATLVVGGVPRQITHLYTQPGNQTEIRCYLGNDKGAYQRVHTSLTYDDVPSAHTMIQTGDKVIVPQFSEGRGQRIGFDSSEGEQPGFANRDLKGRDNTRTKVTGWLDAIPWEKLTKDQQEGCVRLARVFNEALDKVSRDIMKGNAEARNVEIVGSFDILDDTWLMQDGGAATPEAELAASKPE